MGGIARQLDPTTKQGLGNFGAGGLIGGPLMAASGNGKNSQGGKGGEAPSAPDFAAAAAQQSRENHANQTNAFGASSQWSQGPDGQWTQTATLGGPLGQGVTNLSNQIANQDPNAAAHARDQAITANYNQATSRLDPQWQQRQQAQSAELANQGIDLGSDAYNTQMGNFNQGRNDAYSSAMNNAIGLGNQTEMVEMQAQNAPYQRLRELQGLTQQGPNPGGGQYLPAAMAQYQGALQAYGIQQQGKNSMMNGGGNLAALALMAG